MLLPVEKTTTATTVARLLFWILLLPVVLVVAQEGALGAEPNCPHGLTANDIAARSGLDLTGKVALVTGGRSGLGFAIAEALSQQNCTVVIASRNITGNQEAVAQLQALYPTATISYAIFDLEDFDSVKTMASEFLANYSRLDYYFGNAGQGSSGAQPLTVNGYERISQVNYVAQVLLVELLLPLMRQSSGDHPARILLTGSSSHSLACGTLQLAPGNFTEPSCFHDDESFHKAMTIFPFDQDGLNAINSTFGCRLLPGTYPSTKYLMMQLAREITHREKEAGNDNVVAFSWAPGNIHTALNRWASCCVGPIEWAGPSCRYQLPYVGPVDSNGNPDPPNPPVLNHWSSPAHGAMAAIYTSLHANATSSGGQFFATYWQCQPDKGYFAQGITPKGRAEIYDKSLQWAGLVVEDPTNSTVPQETNGETDTASTTGVPTSSPTSSGATAMAIVVQLGILLLQFLLLFTVL